MPRDLHRQPNNNDNVKSETSHMAQIEIPHDRALDYSDPLTGKVAIVSGAGTYGGGGVGNGAAAAILFAIHGAEVCLVDKNIEWTEDIESVIREQGGTSISIQADVTKEDGCKKVVEETVSEFSKVDILHNNVGGGPLKDVTEATIEDWQRSIDTNLMSAVHMCRHTVPEMASSGGGSIINVSSVTALRPKRGSSSALYTATKAGLIGLTRSLAIDHAPDRIRVNSIMPGLIWTPKIEEMFSTEERLERQESTPLPKEGNPWDVGQAAFFFASDLSRFITGVNLPVDGGFLLTSAPN